MTIYTQRMTLIGLGLSFAVALFTAGQCPAAEAGIVINTQPPTVEVTTQGAVVQNEDDYVTVVFNGHGGTPKIVTGTVLATLATADGAFTGNYVGAGVKGLAFRIKNSASKPRVVVMLTANGCTWYNRALVKLGAEPGEWVANNVSLDLLGGWYRDDGKSTAANWDAALRNVEAIGLSMAQVGTASQSVSVDDFRLLLENEVLTPEAVLAQRLFARFGVNSDDALTEAQKALDSDGSGIADWQEILYTQSDPDDGTDDLLIAVHKTPAGQNEVSWSGVAGGRYRVLVADSPAGPFRALTGAEDVSTPVKGRVARPDTEGAAGQRFYRVVQIVQ